LVKRGRLCPGLIGLDSGAVAIDDVFMKRVFDISRGIRDAKEPLRICFVFREKKFDCSLTMQLILS